MSLFSEGQQAEDAGSGHVWQRAPWDMLCVTQHKPGSSWKVERERGFEWKSGSAVFMFSQNINSSGAAGLITENPIICWQPQCLGWVPRLADTVISLNPPSAASNSWQVFFLFFYLIVTVNLCKNAPGRIMGRTEKCVRHNLVVLLSQ